MRKVIFFLCLIASVNSLADGSAFFTGNKLTETCERDSEAFSRGACAGYVVGVTDLHVALVSVGLANRLFCLPSNVTTGQLAKVAEKYLNDRPEDLHMEASLMVVLALQEAFPCESEE